MYRSITKSARTHPAAVGIELEILLKIKITKDYVRNKIEPQLHLKADNNKIPMRQFLFTNFCSNVCLQSCNILNKE
ncbi:hypothetical protein T4A_10208 [Trichinella pseudospiralis]|uniref:Uncharacterized protein n=1 Tax=Trichinella pseudospiralis TaxID=6337 RepID=A0A0V1DQJ1_TRIPS|nr:hypothetical protein T4A_10208 [Trichinella pseudospiralis]